MSMYEQFKTDPTAESKGIWLDYGQFRVLIARAGGANKAFQKKLESLTRPYRRAIQTETIDAAVVEDILRTSYADTVILGWETKVDGQFVTGIEQEGSTELLPVTRENVKATLKALPALFQDIQEQSSNYGLFRASLREEAAGN